MENTHTHALTISLSMEYQSFVAPQTRPDFDAKETYCAHYFTLWSIKPLDPNKLFSLLDCQWTPRSPQHTLIHSLARTALRRRSTTKNPTP